MASNFFDNPASTYGYHNFLPGALDALEEDDDLVILPPDVDSLTDEEEFDENEIGPLQIPNDVTGHVEIIRNINVDDEDWNSSDDEPLSNLKKRLKTHTKKEKLDYNWNKSEPVYKKWNTSDVLDEYTQQKQSIDGFLSLNPVQIFEKFIDDSVTDYIVEQTLLYASQHNRHEFRVTQEEIRTFIAILFLSGYHQLPQERMYWSTEEDLGLDIVSAAMSRNKYDQIKQNIHFADNSHIVTTDKMFKLRPLMNILNTKFKQWGILHTYLFSETVH